MHRARFFVPHQNKYPALKCGTLREAQGLFSTRGYVHEQSGMVHAVDVRRGSVCSQPRGLGSRLDPGLHAFGERYFYYTAEWDGTEPAPFGRPRPIFR